jgi:ABC-type multidrug transport system fused ATPase/permease subunit
MMEWAATAATAMVALEVSLRVTSGGLQFDRALAVLLLTPEFFLPLRQLAIKYHIGATGKAAAERIFAILDLPAQRQSARASEGQHDLTTTLSHNLTTSRSHDLTTSPAEIRFEDVSVAYQQGERPALQAFSLVLPRGQTVALVGPTGAGKTTVANVLLRFVEPDAGQVLVDGQPLDRIDRAAWRRQVAWVPQLPHLFHGTAADNIRLARPEASLDDVIAAAQAAHAHEFIQALPQGYATPLGEQGARLSGGQRQRLAIARAFLKDAPLLILDEATASLDAASDALIRDALARLMAGRTVLVIAHRLELAYTADQVVVMAAGRAAESGAHRDLLARDGLYRQLVASYEAV